ncbi:MAG: OmpA family protein [Gammaproteobacteria bacterium]|nr:OmpA family protein [Gammaproteobacteria bacterium]
MKQEFKRLLLLITLVLSPMITHGSDVVSENMVFLKEDGKSYLLQRSMRTSHDKYDFHLDKDKGPATLYYIDPNEYEWDVSKPDANILKFNDGTFTVMYPGNYGDQVTIDGNRVYTLNTWDGETLEDGHFGSWNKPDNFSRFVQAWVVPETFRIISYESNREGEWIERKNTLTFFAKDVNDVTFTVRYELIDADGDGVADSNDRCKDTPAGVAVDVTGCEVDSDHDGVLDKQDRCADTPEGAVVDKHGCELDGDQDGVVDRLDKCPGTAEDAPVDRSGCELDCDGDGVVNSKDNCPRTPAGAEVDAQGCVLDTDGDGVTDGHDRCPGTPAGASVDAQGCELDTDGDGVTDSNDLCPATPAGAQVDAQGCERDSDGDGVLNAADLCPHTAAGVEVDVTGCEREQPILLRGVNFHYDTANLTPEAMNILDGIARSLLSYPEIRLEVAGHTDSSGDDMYNLDLSQRRSEAVRTYLISKGVNADMFSAHGYGEERPVESNATAAGRAENRRVELIRQGQ